MGLFVCFSVHDGTNIIGPFTVIQLNDVQLKMMTRYLLFDDGMLCSQSSLFASDNCT